MSDYGFKTVNDIKNKDMNISINAKYPMMGFDMGHKPMSFRTIRITDAKEIPISEITHSPDYVAPARPTDAQLQSLYYGYNDPQGNFWPITGYANKTHGYFRQLICKYEHGYKFRPACYATITGNINKKTTTNAVGTPIAGRYYWQGSVYDSNWNLMQSFNTTTQTTGLGGNLFPWINGMKAQSGEPMNRHYFNYTNNNIPTTSSTRDGLQNGMRSLFVYYMSDSFTDKYPFEFSVDDKYVYVYRYAYWSDMYGRLHFDHTFYDDGYNWRYEIKDEIRVKMIEQLAGSNIDITIMLFPYKMEDLL